MMKTIPALIIWFVFTTSAWADSFFCLIFSYDSKPISIPCKCHVWGTFVHLRDDGKLVKEVCLSWEPDKINLLNRSRPGQNATLEETLEAGKNKSIRLWGPYEIDKQFFDKACEQHCTPGNYRFIDGAWRNNSQNCIHRLSDVGGHHRTGIYWGWWAADSVMKHFRRQGLIRPTNRGDEIYRLLGLYRHSIRRM